MDCEHTCCVTGHRNIPVDKAELIRSKLISTIQTAIACGYTGRSANSQIIQLMLKFISDYEKEHGKIDLPETKG